MADDRPRHALNPNTEVGLSGWAVDPAHLDRSVSLAVAVDGRAVATISATRPRNGVKKLYGGDGRHGFVSVLPLELYDGAAKPLRVERIDTGEVLFDGVAPFADLRWGGTVSGLMRAGKKGLEGWVVDRADPDAPVAVELWMDGRRLADLVADQETDALPYPEGPRRRHGFAVAWPGEALDGAEHRFELRRAGEAAAAMAVVVVRPDPATRLGWTGELTVRDGRVGGVLLAEGAGSLAAPLVLSGGETVLATLWVRSGQRIDAGLFGETRPRLDGPLVATLDGRELALRFGADGAGRVVAEWRLEPSAGVVEGWAVDLARPETPVEVALVVDGAPALTAAADADGGFRFDLATAPIRAPFSELRMWINGVEPTPERTARYSRGGPACEVTGAVWRDFRLEVDGWALDFTAPQTPVAVELLLDGQVVATALSDPAAGTPGAFGLSVLTGPVDLAERVRLRVAGGEAAPLPHIEMASGPVVETAPDAGAEDEIVGLLERIGDATARGWIANASRPEARPVAVLWLDERPLALAAGAFDVDEAETAPGARGFVFHLPPDLDEAAAARLTVRPRIGRGHVGLADGRLEGRGDDPVGDAAPGERLTVPPPTPDPVTVLVLAREGGAAVGALLDSAVQHETGGHAWVVLDAGADPATDAACERARAAGLNVRRRSVAAHQMGEAAREEAAGAATETLIVMGDDVRLTGPVLGALAGALALPGAGMAGSTTVQALGEGAALETAGRRIVAAANGGTRRPYETAGAGGAGPAWTALPSDGPVAMRRAAFVELGGLDDTVAAYEQTADLALRLNSRTGLGVVTLAERVDLASDPAPVQDRRASIFRARWDGSLRTALRGPGGVGDLTGTRPVVGLLVDEDQAAPAAPDGWRVRRLPPAAWSDLGEVDVAVALSPAFEPAGVVAARPHLRLIRLAEGDDLAARLKADDGLRIAIKTPARKGQEAHWGDFHFANSLADALTAQGHTVRVDVRDDWYGPLAATDDVVVVLRGLAVYRPQPHQTNLMWIISHPEAVPVAELADYDHVFVASEPYAAALSGLTDRPVEPLLQCTDPVRFNAGVDTTGMPADELVFVGNARGLFRPAVQWAMESGRGLALYGRGWDGLVPPDAVRTHYVPNEILAGLYRAGGVVLCDHWDDMRRLGFISNRVFDALAAGAVLATDPVEGLEAVFGAHTPPVVGSAEDVAAVARNADALRPKAKAASDWVLAHHTFAHRARRIVEVAEGALALQPVLKPRG